MNCHRNNTGNASVTELVTEKADKPLKRSDLDRRLLASSAPHAAETCTTFRMALRIRSTVDEKEQKQLLMDLEVVMKSNECPCIVQFYGALFKEGDCWICMELMDTSLDKLYKYIYEVLQRRIPESILGKITVAELSYRKPLPILRQRSKSSGLVDNVIAESRRPFSWCVALLYFRVLPLHFSKHKNSIKTNMIKLKLNSLLKKHSKLVFILDHTLPPKMRVPCLRADVNERKTSLEIVPISKISNSRGSDQKYKLNCKGNYVPCKSCDAAWPVVIGILEKDKITATTIPITMPGNACKFKILSRCGTLTIGKPTPVWVNLADRTRECGLKHGLPLFTSLLHSQLN
ncbi:mitogen-activated protein kinase kinase [Homalodisca vitripennis]|nr:mitogen-activated protein kinase kinase [Homalodisca vitripennis]